MQDGTLALNKQSISLDQLEANIRSLMISTQQTVVIINADTAVNHGNVMAVLNQVKKMMVLRWRSQKLLKISAFFLAFSF